MIVCGLILGYFWWPEWVENLPKRLQEAKTSKAQHEQIIATSWLSRLQTRTWKAQERSQEAPEELQNSKKGSNKLLYLILNNFEAHFKINSCLKSYQKQDQFRDCSLHISMLPKQRKRERGEEGESHENKTNQRREGKGTQGPYRALGAL